MWQNSLGHCVLKADFSKGKKELAVSLFQVSPIFSSFLFLFKLFLPLIFDLILHVLSLIVSGCCVDVI